MRSSDHSSSWTWSRGLMSAPSYVTRTSVQVSRYGASAAVIWETAFGSRRRLRWVDCLPHSSTVVPQSAVSGAGLASMDHVVRLPNPDSTVVSMS
ncbi:hypothetical protein AR457_39330 [Streptomyces agglomeratus]|nr:hypothetical protein AR457_39330 [Streptomyces agglomeratus]